MHRCGGHFALPINWYGDTPKLAHIYPIAAHETPELKQSLIDPTIHGQNRVPLSHHAEI